MDCGAVTLVPLVQEPSRWKVARGTMEKFQVGVASTYNERGFLTRHSTISIKSPESRVFGGNLVASPAIPV